jgi:nucleotide-binding universal stress UspA family protein
MFKDVLVGVDARGGGRDAIALARKLVDGGGGKLTLAHVRQGATNPYHAVVPGLLDEERDASVKLLEKEREEAGVDAELVSVVAQSPGRGLHEEADARAVDLIVVGSCKRGVLGRVMVGDDASAALNGAPCAVAIAIGGYSQTAGPLAKLGVAYNGSPESEGALELARELASETGASVSALEVVHLSAYAFGGLTMVPPIGDAIEAMLNDAQARMDALEGVDGRASYGLAGEDLARFGDELDLLIVGSRSYGPVRRLVYGSTSSYLERHAHCSLLVLPRAWRRGVGASEDRAHDAVPAEAR